MIQISRRKIFGTILMVVGLTAQTLSAQPAYNIANIGLVGSEHTRDDGYVFSYTQQFNAAGQVSGNSSRYNNGSTHLGNSAWLFNGTSTVAIGLVGGEHTRDDGYKFSFAYYQFNQAGQVVGRSDRYNNGSTMLGDSAWLYNGTSTVDIGLIGSEHTRDDGYKFSRVQQLNEAGQVIGVSSRYNNGSTFLGQSAWLYNGSSTVEIGLVGSEHTRDDGYRVSNVEQLNEAGQGLGHSGRYNNGSTFLGRSAWLSNGTSTVDIGLVGSEHTRNDGYKASFAEQLNQAGQVSGYAERFNNGSTFLGRSVWLYNGTSTVDIGLVGSEHTHNNGYKWSQAQQLNEAGQVIGFSERYNNGSTFLGRSAWLSNGTSTVEIGLVGGEHTRDDGYRASSAEQLNGAGQVIGYSDRYNNGSTSLGRSAWLSNGTSTVDIGLVGSEHTRNDGSKYSLARQLNEAGQVIGYSERYDGSTFSGYSAWVFNGTSTLDIGLAGSEHTGSDGYRASFAEQLNEAGYVIGMAERFTGTDSLGQDAWVYDPNQDTTFSLQMSLRSDGYAFSQADFVSEDGIVLGFYELYDGASLLGERAFFWSSGEGLFDLGSLAQGGLSANGWESLYNGIASNGLQHIVGVGQTSGTFSGSQSVFLMTAIPEPSSAMIMTLAGVLLLSCRRRRENEAGK